MKAFKATIEVLVDPIIIGPDASTEWKTPASAADFFSALLSENPNILDWKYVKPDRGTYEVVEFNYEDYEEGDMDVLIPIEVVEP